MIFVTAINCMDGRIQIPVIDWLKKEYKADYVDMITEPGPNKILSENKDQFLIDSIKKRVEISVKKHQSRLIATIGHHDCAGNPVDKELKIKQINTAIKIIKSWEFGVQVIGLWVNENWQVERVK